MARIHESSKSTEQEKQDYLYGVVPKKWCETHRISGHSDLREEQWLTYVGKGNPYNMVLFQILKFNYASIRYKGWWTPKAAKTGPLYCEEDDVHYEDTFTPGDQGYWVPIPDEMAAKMRILHGF